MLKRKFVPPGKKKQEGDATKQEQPKQNTVTQIKKPVIEQKVEQKNNEQQENVNPNKMEIEEKKDEKQETKPQQSTVNNSKPLTGLNKPMKKLGGFKAPTKVTTTGNTTNNINNAKNNNSTQQTTQQVQPNAEDKFYKCFFSKDLKKKQKVFTDGIVLVIGFKLKIFDMNGQLVYSGTKSRIQRDDPSNPNEFSIGMYFVQYEHQMDKDEILKQVKIDEKEFLDAKSLQVQQEIQQKQEDLQKNKEISGNSLIVDGVDMSTYEYYKCFYTKNINKKHKVWNDGFVVYETKKVVIYEESGNKVYDTYKSKGYQTENDNEFVFGSYIVQQEQRIKNADFLSGRCFIQHVQLEKKVLGGGKKVVKQKAFKLQGEKEEVTVEQKIEDKIKEIPEGVSLLTKADDRVHYPIFIDKFLNQNLRPHQVIGIKFMYECISGMRGPSVQGCILADSMGLGKTLQAITVAYISLKRSPYSSIKPLAEKVVIVSPLSLVNNWNNEFKKWIEGTKLIPLCAMGSPDNIRDKVKQFATSHYRVLLISYEQFSKHVDLMKNKVDLMIFDEGHKLKNDKMKLYQEIQKFSCKRRIILTGTPLQNRLDEFYACVSLVNPQVFVSLDKFKNVFANIIEAGMKQDANQLVKFKAQERSKELIKIISSFILRRKANVLESLLPPKTEYFLFLKLSQIQKAVYSEIMKNKSLISGGGGNQGDVFGLMIIMRKLLNHPNLVATDNNKTSEELKPLLYQDKFKENNENFSIKNWENSSKFLFVMQILDNIRKINNLSDTKQNEKVIIVSQWSQTLDLLEEMIKDLGFGYVKLDGSVAGNKRQALVDKFQDRESKYTVFLLGAKAGGVGLNLTAANRMIMMDVDWNPAVDQQVMGRLWRDGQDRPVHIYRLIACGTLEEKILQRQFLKETMANNIVDKSNNGKNFDTDNMKKLFIWEENKCLSFEKKENEIESFQDLSPDFNKEMKNYINFVKRYVRDKKDVNPEGENEFEKDDVFLKEDEEIGEEIEDDEEEENQFQEVKQGKNKKQKMELEESNSTENLEESQDKQENGEDGNIETKTLNSESNDNEEMKLELSDNDDKNQNQENKQQEIDDEEEEQKKLVTKGGKRKPNTAPKNKLLQKINKKGPKN